MVDKATRGYIVVICFVGVWLTAFVLSWDFSVNERVKIDKLVDYCMISDDIDACCQLRFKHARIRGICQDDTVYAKWRIKNNAY